MCEERHEDCGSDIHYLAAWAPEEDRIYCELIIEQVLPIIGEEAMSEIVDAQVEEEEEERCERCDELESYCVCEECSDCRDIFEPRDLCSECGLCGDCCLSERAACGCHGVRRSGEICETCECCFTCCECWTCSSCTTTYGVGDDLCGECDVCRDCCECANGMINDYGARAEKILGFVGKAHNRMYAGVELEVELVGRDTDGKIEEVYEAATAADGTAWYILKHDGSLDDGVEIVTAPMGLKLHRKYWTEWCDSDVPKRGLRAEKASTCGLHVHISRSGLSKLTIGKMMHFMGSATNTIFLEKIGRRPANSYCAQAPRRISDVEHDDIAKATRYVGFNIRPSRTVEFRFWQSSLNKVHIIAAVEFAYALAEFCAMVSMRKCGDYRCFLAWLREDANRKSYPTLHDYVLNRLSVQAKTAYAVGD